MDELGVCIIGAGEMGRLHARAWTGVPGAAVVAVCDADADRAADLADETGADVCADYRQGLRHTGVHVVSICVPAGLHAEFAEFAASCGKHILCEKPMALTLDQAARMKQAAENAGVKFMIGLCHRFFRTQELAIQIVQRGDLGAPRHYHCASVLGIRPKIAMHDQQGNGGPVVDVLCHYVDDMCRVLGSHVTRVCARGHTFAENHPNLSSVRNKAIDTAAVLLDFANGDTGAWSISWGAPTGIYTGTQQEVWGPDGFLRINVNDSLEVLHADRRVLYENLKVDQIQREIDHFALCIREDKPVGPDGAAGEQLLAVSLAVLESIRTGEPVSVNP